MRRRLFDSAVTMLPSIYGTSDETIRPGDEGVGAIISNGCVAPGPPGIVSFCQSIFYRNQLQFRLHKTTLSPWELLSFCGQQCHLFRQLRNSPLRLRHFTCARLYMYLFISNTNSTWHIWSVKALCLLRVTVKSVCSASDNQVHNITRLL